MMSKEEQLWFFFNELSVRALADNSYEGHSRMDDMVAAMADMMADRSAALISLHDISFWEFELASGYSISDWLNYSDRDAKVLLLSIETKHEIPEEISRALQDRFHLSEFVVTQEIADSERGSMVAKGLGAAFLFDGIGVSIRSEGCWSQIKIPLQHIWLDADCQEQKNDVEALNLSESDNVEVLTKHMLERSRRSLRDHPHTLADRKIKCFPHLAFGLDIDEHLQALPRSILRLAIQKLLTIDEASRQWRNDPNMKLPDLPMVKTESEPTMQMFSDQRRFRNSRGEVAVFKLHANVGIRYRIYLRLSDAARGIEIGYIGDHLQTVKYR